MATNPLGLTLPLRLGANGYFANTSDVMEQIKSNLTNLLLTQRGERPFQPDFGCDIALNLFEKSADDGQAEIQAAIQTSVSQWMPFLRIDAVNVTKNQTDHVAQVSVVYTLLTTNTTDSISLGF